MIVVSSTSGVQAVERGLGSRGLRAFPLRAPVWRALNMGSDSPAAFMAVSSSWSERGLPGVGNIRQEEQKTKVSLVHRMMTLSTKPSGKQKTAEEYLRNPVSVKNEVRDLPGVTAAWCEAVVVDEETAPKCVLMVTCKTPACFEKVKIHVEQLFKIESEEEVPESIRKKLRKKRRHRKRMELQEGRRASGKDYAVALGAPCSSRCCCCRFVESDLSLHRRLFLGRRNRFHPTRAGRGMANWKWKNPRDG